MMRKIAGIASRSAKVVIRLVTGAGERTLPPPTSRELELIADLRQRVSEIEKKLKVNAAAEEWVQNQLRLAHLIAIQDPRTFLRWDVIRGTMFVGDSWCVRKELHELQARPDWSSRWQGMIEETEHGCPSEFFVYLKSSGNLIHHAYHIYSMREKLGLHPEQLNSICEFGGGYGSMCRLFYKMGFKGNYQIIDLPVFCELQRFYIAWLGLPLGVGGLHVQSDLDAAVSWQPSGHSLFIATWSMSESPLPVRARLVPYLQTFEQVLIAYQESFDKYPNVEYFNQLAHELSANYSVIKHALPHMPLSHYLFAMRK
jgi:hypothetical protein